LFDVRAKQQLNRGYSDGLARGFELVVAPLIMGAIGWLLDAWFGTEPFLAIGLGVFGVAGVFVKLWTGYDREMRVVEAGKPWARPDGTAPDGTVPDSTAPHSGPPA
jgi:F0F1-type ATP synthase assembly protein I